LNEYKILIEQLFKKAAKNSITDMEAYFREGERFSVNIYKGEIEDYKLSNSIGLGFRGFYNGKIGYSYTEKVSEDSFDMLIKDVKENATINDSEDYEVIYEGSKHYENVKTYNEELDKVTEVEKIQFAKDMEKYAYELDKRVKACQGCLFSSGTSNVIIMNNKGLYLNEKSNGAFSYIFLAVGDDKEISTGFEFVISNDFTKYNAKNMATKAVNDAIKMLGAKSIKSGNRKILLEARISADLLATIQGIFSARAVQKGVSMLKGKLNKQVANKCVTLVDNPFLENGSASSAFDGEGVATKYKKIIENGILKTYLYNLKTAIKDGVESTGNASRDSYKSTIGIAPSNLYFDRGDKTFAQLVEEVKDGVYITDLDGMHSGFSTISGDFSLGAKGFLIENGKLSYAINQITVSGNYFELLNNIESVGNDLLFSSSGTGSPSLIIKDLAIAGE